MRRLIDALPTWLILVIVVGIMAAVAYACGASGPGPS